jgi:hypothetical protein
MPLSCNAFRRSRVRAATALGLQSPWCIPDGGTQNQLLHPTQMQCSADLEPVMCWHT